MGRNGSNVAYFNSDGETCGCLVHLEHSEAVSMNQALQNSSVAKILIVAGPPYTIQLVNEAFAAMFKLPLYVVMRQ